jgi:chromosome segregation ATPase
MTDDQLEKFIDELESHASDVYDAETFAASDKNRAASLLSAAADRLESMQGDLDYLKERANELAAEKARLEEQLEAAPESSKQQQSSSEGASEADSGSFEGEDEVRSRDISSNKEDVGSDKASLSGVGCHIRGLKHKQAELEARLEDLEEATDVKR